MEEERVLIWQTPRNGVPIGAEEGLQVMLTKSN